ncbi:MAG: lamin tail domain-containing protein [Chitinophagaceae bacterium]
MKGILILLCLSILQHLSAQEIDRYDIIIQEIYADPTPSHGLPSSEFIEIRNHSSKDIDLKNFTISNGTTTGKIIYATILKPDSLLILCSSSSVTALSVFGRTQAVSSFPSLSNDMDTISIASPNGLTIHAVNYDLSWYHDDFKQQGGWSLEMIQSDKSCLGKENWTSSMNPIGGTPGKFNSVTQTKLTILPLQMSYTFFQDSVTLKMVFNKSLATLTDKTEFKLDTIHLFNVRLEPPLYNIISANIPAPIYQEDPYDISLMHNRDCLGTAFEIHTKAAIFSKPESSNEIINEILFNPDIGGFDYVELYNKTSKTFDLSNLYLANRNTSGNISSITKITDEHWPLTPEGFIVFSEDCNWVKQKFRTDSTCWCFQINQLPSFPDEEGNVLILNQVGSILDELHYDEKWHNKLIFNNDGVAMERISPNTMTNDPLNWYSASSQSGYGTPGSRNSQSKSDDLSTNLMVLSSPIISPDNDGRDDFVLMTYHLPINGYIANIWITDTKGQVMKNIARNELCGITGQFRWDGLDANGTKVLPGNYIFVIELFHLSGKVKRLYKTISVYY